MNLATCFLNPSVNHQHLAGSWRKALCHQALGRCGDLGGETANLIENSYGQWPGECNDLPMNKGDWLVVWNMIYFSQYWECHNPN
jgi:hypothetical protein